MKTKTTHGGARPGAGRPAALVKTTTVRIPEALKPAVLKAVSAFKQPMPADALPAELNPPELRLPLFAEGVPAGFPSPATDYVEDRLDLNELVIQHAEATFFVRAKGYSMLGAGIHDGDILVVDKSINAQHGHVVIAAVDGEFTVKRLYSQQGKVKLRAENPDYPDIDFAHDRELHIWGVVTNVVHKL